MRTPTSHTVLVIAALALSSCSKSPPTPALPKVATERGEPAPTREHDQCEQAADEAAVKRESAHPDHEDMGRVFGQ